MSELNMDPRVSADKVGSLFVDQRVANTRPSVSICANCTQAADEDRPELHCGPRGETNNPKCSCQHRHGELIRQHEPKTGPAGE